MQMPYAYVGTVTDNKDEDGLNRVKVSAQLEGESVSFWLPCLTAAAGNGTGFSALPDVGAQVLVLAFGKSRDEQIVLGSFWSDSSVYVDEADYRTPRHIPPRYLVECATLLLHKHSSFVTMQAQRFKTVHANRSCDDFPDKRKSDIHGTNNSKPS